MGEAKVNKKAHKIEETEALKLALFASQIDAATAKQQVLNQQFENIKQHLAQVTKDRDAFQELLVGKYGIDIKADSIDLDTRTINRGGLKKKLEAVPPPDGAPATSPANS
jgi:hypothetical protein